jgi:uncharacterized protein (DUF362 family)/NAD-dependent dihydropyrimidine dehydrogenase PreA subunit
MLVDAVVRYLRGRGITDIVLADSPGGAYTPTVLRGIYAACGLKGEGYTLNTDCSFSRVHKGGFRAFNIIQPILNADIVINLPKLKTHGMTVMSGAIKNLFGAIPGLQKPELHCLNPDPGAFAAMLVELSQVVAPDYTIIDAVDAMEGDGPSGGEVCHPGLTVASRNLYSLDRFCADEILQVGAENVPMLVAAQNLLADSEIVGDWQKPSKGFALPKSVSIDFVSIFPNALRRPMRAFLDKALVALPRVKKKICIGCGKCAESCPQHTIEIYEKKAQIDHENCISCFCCQEMCPVKAIDTARKIRL